MRVLITGADGFIGKNLVAHLSERTDIEVLSFTRDDAPGTLPDIVRKADFVFHLAGVNRPLDPEEFRRGNADLTSLLCDAVKDTDRKIPVVYTSSIQAELSNPYGVSKLQAEQALISMSEECENSVHLFRLPNVFGKWAKPNYNSAVATFCYNIVRGFPITINNPAASITLVYIDDVIDKFISLMDGRAQPQLLMSVEPEYSITVGDLAKKLEGFRDSRETLIMDSVGTGLTRALYSTYLSYFPPESFTYGLQKHGDPRGVFVEMLKTRDSGQFSFFTAHPGITRGGHYHHSKTEKFLVIKGNACFRFRHIVTGEFHELHTSGGDPEVVETVPGWTHDITNVGEDEMIVMLWANEIFDRERPDTYVRPVGTEA